MLAPAIHGQRNGIVVALLVLTTISVGQALFYVQGRHRLGVEALLIVFSGRAAGWLLTRAGARFQR